MEMGKAWGGFTAALWITGTKPSRYNHNNSSLEIYNQNIEINAGIKLSDNHCLQIDWYVNISMLLVSISFITAERERWGGEEREIYRKP